MVTEVDERREVERLREQNAKLRQYNDTLLRERGAARDELALVRRALRNPASKQYAPVALAILDDITEAEARGKTVAAAGWRKVWVPGIAEAAGCSEWTGGAHIAFLRDSSVFEAELRDAWTETPTGKRCRSTWWVRVDDRQAALKRLAYAEAPDPTELAKGARKGQGWGGRRVVCPVHPDAGVVKRWHCAQCNRLLHEVRVPAADAPSTEDVPEPQFDDSDSHTFADNQEQYEQVARVLQTDRTESGVAAANVRKIQHLPVKIGLDPSFVSEPDLALEPEQEPSGEREQLAFVPEEPPVCADFPTVAAQPTDGNSTNRGAAGGDAVTDADDQRHDAGDGAEAEPELEPLTAEELIELGRSLYLEASVDPNDPTQRGAALREMDELPDGEITAVIQWYEAYLGTVTADDAEWLVMLAWTLHDRDRDPEQRIAALDAALPQMQVWCRERAVDAGADRCICDPGRHVADLDDALPSVPSDCERALSRTQEAVDVHAAV